MRYIRRRYPRTFDPQIEAMLDELEREAREDIHEINAMLGTEDGVLFSDENKTLREAEDMSRWDY